MSSNWSLSHIPHNIMHERILINCKETLSKPPAEASKEFALPSQCGSEKKGPILPQLNELSNNAVCTTALNGAKRSWTRNLHNPSQFAISVPSEYSWEPRVVMFAIAQGYDSPSSHIFSLSIEPTDPAIEQPIYYKNSYTKCKWMGENSNSPAEKQTIIEDQLQKPKLITGTEEKIPVSLGFLKPFEYFYNDKIIPEIASDACPANVQEARVSSMEDIDSQIEDIQPSNLRERVKHIVGQFLLDAHARKLYLITLQPYYTPDDPVKRKLFIKG